MDQSLLKCLKILWKSKIFPRHCLRRLRVWRGRALNAERLKCNVVVNPMVSPRAMGNLRSVRWLSRLAGTWSFCYFGLLLLLFIKLNQLS